MICPILLLQMLGVVIGQTPGNCCETLRLTRTYESGNIDHKTFVYNKTQNGKPVYQMKIREYVFCLEFTTHWKMDACDYYSNEGFMIGTTNEECPEDVKKWKSLDIPYSAKVECEEIPPVKVKMSSVYKGYH